VYSDALGFSRERAGRVEPCRELLNEAPPNAKAAASEFSDISNISEIFSEWSEKLDVVIAASIRFVTVVFIERKTSAECF
jgi:hypothetical protein